MSPRSSPLPDGISPIPSPPPIRSLPFLWRYYTCFSQSTSATSGRVADLMVSWPETGGREWRASQLGLASYHYTADCLFPSLLSPSSVVLRQRPSDRTRLPNGRRDGPPAVLTQSAAVTELSNGRTLLHAAEKHVPIACSYINIRVGLIH